MKLTFFSKVGLLMVEPSLAHCCLSFSELFKSPSCIRTTAEVRGPLIAGLTSSKVIVHRNAAL